MQELYGILCNIFPIFPQIMAAEIYIFMLSAPA